MQHIKDIISLIESALINIEEEEENKYSGAIIYSGYDSEVDELRETIFDGKEWLGNYQEQLSSETGINNLKIKFIHLMRKFIYSKINSLLLQ